MTQARMMHFETLDPAQKAEAIQRLAATGMSPHGIACATQLSAEYITQILAEQREASQPRRS